MEKYVPFTIKLTELEFIEQMILASRSIPIDELIEMNKDVIEQMPAVFTELSVLLLKSNTVDKVKLIRSIVANESRLRFKEVVEKSVNSNDTSIKDWEDAVVDSGRIDIMFIYAFNFYNEVDIERIIKAFNKLQINTEIDAEYARLFASYILPKQSKETILERIKLFELKNKEKKD